MKSPAISVNMPVYNGEQYLSEAIESILAQTHTDFELVIVNDGSTDGTADILDSYTVQDRRIKVLHNETNRGVSATRNRALAASSAEFVAIMDADDTCDPTRLAKQLAYLQTHPDIGAVGTWSRYVNKNGEPLRERHSPHDPIEIKWSLLFSCTVLPASIMVRRHVIDNAGAYPLGAPVAKDYALLLEINRTNKIAVIPEPLYFYRDVPTGLSNTYPQRQRDECITYQRYLFELMLNKQVARLTVENVVKSYYEREPLGDSAEIQAAFQLYYDLYRHLLATHPFTITDRRALASQFATHLRVLVGNNLRVAPLIALRLIGRAQRISFALPRLW
ncbi:MAG: glycosyltransferase family 2 protein [Candidatus Promineifilaceae bacterium]